MSASSSTTSSPAVESLHNPAQAAKVPAGPFSGLDGQRALLAKKLAKSSNPSTVSPTDNMMTPVSAKLSQAKKKHFNNKAIKALNFGAPDADEEQENKVVEPTSELTAQ